MKKMFFGYLLLITTTFSNSEVWRPFNDSSPWNQLINSVEKVDQNSDQQISYINEYFRKKSYIPVGECRLEANMGEWSIPVYYVDSLSENPQNIEVSSHSSWGKEIKAPIPSYAKPSTGLDAHLAIVDKKRQKVWGFYDFQGQYPNYSSGNACETDLTGNGVIEGGSREAGTPIIAGLIRPEEVRAGKIEHALAFSFDARDGYEEFILPATQGTDNDSTNSLKAMPMGTRLQLKPDIDISKYPKGAKIVLEALKKYGMYLVDENDSKSMSLYFQSNGDWKGIFEGEDIDAINEIKASDFRVINYSE
ncbi:MAG: hypothetical protein KAH04_06025 [Psychrilyobacter sp.]|nr:hypothetical protein [Psychrilyobacter sp.]